MAKSSEMRVKVVAVNDTETVGTAGFTKRVLEGRIEGEYPEDFAFEFQKDKCVLLDDILEGTYVTIHYNTRGRKVENNKEGLPLDKPLFFITLVGWKVEV